MSEYDIAIKIAGKLDSSFQGAIRGAKEGLTGLGISGKVGGLALKGVGLAAKAAAATITAAGAGVAAVGAFSVKTGKEFEAAMSSAAATAGATGEEYKKLEAAAMEMGRTTSKTASESANALEYMALAGWDVDTSIKALPSVLKLSEASGMELARTSDLVTDSMASLGVSVDALPGYLDVCAKAQNKSNQSAEQLMEAYLNVGGTMKDLGVPIEESAAALGVMANRGRKGEEAGQALSAIITNLTTGAGQAGKMMKKLGVSAFDSSGKFIGLKATLEKVNEATRSLSDEERNAALAAIGGKQHVKDLNKLLGGLNDTTADGVQEWAALEGELRNCNGALTEMRNIKMDNLEGDLATLKSAAEDFGIHVYQHMQTPLRGLVSYGTSAIYRLTDALENGGFMGLAKEIGSVMSDAVTKIAEHAPEFIEGAAVIIENLVNGIDQNSDAIGRSVGHLITAIGAAVIKLAPRIAVTGVHILLAIGKGIIDNLDVLKDAAIEAVTYFWNAIKDGFKSFKDFLGDESVEPFKKVLALLPLLIAGFAIFDGIGGAIKGFATNFKSAGKAIPGAAKGISGAGSQLSKAAKNFLAFGAAIALVAGGLFLMVLAAERISTAGPGAIAALAIMAGGIIALMAIAGAMGAKLQAAQGGLLAFGGAILMAAGGLSLMALAATQIAAAGPMAIAALAIMVGGMIALLAVAGAMGPSLAGATAGLLAFGGAILMASAGFMIMAVAATMVANAGVGAIVTFGIMTVGLIALMAVAGAMGPVLTAGAVGLIAFGAALLLAGAGMLLLTQAAIQIAAAGPGAGIALALMMVGIIAFGAIAGALSPILLLGALAIAALGGAFMLVAGAALMGAQALSIMTTCLPMLSDYVVQGVTAIMLLSGALTVFAAGAGLSGAAALLAAAGFGALALAVAACDLAVIPLALSMGTVAASMLIIGTSAMLAGAGLQIIRNSTEGVAGALASLIPSLAPAALAFTPFALGVTTAALAMGGFAAALLGADVGMAALVVTLNLSLAALSGINLAIGLFKNQAQMIGPVALIAAVGFTRLTTASTPLAAALGSVVAPMTGAALAAVTLAAGLLGSVGGAMALGTAMGGIATAVAVAVVGFRLMGPAVTASITEADAILKTGMVSMRTSMTQGVTAIVAVLIVGMTLMVNAFQNGGVRLIILSVLISAGIKEAFNIDLYSSGLNIMLGLIRGMESMRGLVALTAASIASAAARAVNNALKIHSPSRVLMESGQYTGEGLALGMQESVPAVRSAATSMTEPIRSGVVPEVLSSSTPSNPSAGGATININLSYTIEGNADREVLAEAARMTESDIRRIMDEYFRDRGRTAFA